ncbi:portal protein [Fluviispira vulneris]|uniref:portal protein n=1 Tax=Fluviispira vulneris TaxID=2763012 RepID=UPI0016492F2A|nr:hypothetical protein [Fluviispira vulneris]
MNNQYYAAADTKTATAKIMQLIKSSGQFNDCFSSVWKRNIELYYKNALSENLGFAGRQGELIKMSVPQARSLVRQTISIICKQKLFFKSIMRSTDYASFANGKIAQAIANKLVRDKKIDVKMDRAAEQIFIYGQSFWHCTWYSDGGTLVHSEDGEPKMTGDVKVSVVNPSYVFYDLQYDDWQDLPWAAVAEKYNRHDLIALHPELRDELLKINRFSGTKVTEVSAENDDTILVYHYYHKPSPAVPRGRMAILCSESCVLYDGENPYECIPIIQNLPEQMNDQLRGYPLFCNLSATQEMLDVSFSTMATNQAAFGVQSILNPRGSNIDIAQVEGMQFIDYTPQNIDGGGKPEALQLTKTPPEVIESIRIYTEHMSVIANVNSALRGQPPTGVTAGNAIATLCANSVEFMSSLSRCLYVGIEEVVTLSVKFYRMFGAERQIVSIADGNTSYVKEFKSSELADFERVKLDIVNPIMNTISGRRDTAELALQHGLVKNLGEYFLVLEGQAPEQLYSSQLNESALAQKENDDLLAGIDCPVLTFDDHQAHIEKHKDLLRNPEIRRSSEHVAIILQHIAEHENHLQQQQQPPPLPEQPPSLGGAVESGGGSVAPPLPSQPPDGSTSAAQPASPAQPIVSL